MITRSRRGKTAQRILDSFDRDSFYIKETPEKEEVKEIDEHAGAVESEEEMELECQTESLLKKSSQGKRKASSNDRSAENSSKKHIETQKKPWTSVEMNSVRKHFLQFITMFKVPGKSDIESVLRKDKNLSQRTWRNVKDQVYNLIKKQRKC